MQHSRTWQQREAARREQSVLTRDQGRGGRGRDEPHLVAGVAVAEEQHALEELLRLVGNGQIDANEFLDYQRRR